MSSGSGVLSPALEVMFPVSELHSPLWTFCPLFRESLSPVLDVLLPVQRPRWVRVTPNLVIPVQQLRQGQQDAG